MGSICMQQTRQSIEQRDLEKDDACDQDWYSDDTNFTQSQQFQIAVVNPSLTYDYGKLKKNKNQIEYFLKSLGSKRILKTSSTKDDQILKTISKAPYTNQFVQMVHIAYYGHFPLSFSPDNIQLLTEYNIFFLIFSRDLLELPFKKIIKQQRQIFLCCINQVFSEHINLNAEQFREKFVSHQGKKKLEVYNLWQFHFKYDWPDIVKQFSKQIKKNIGKERQSQGNDPSILTLCIESKLHIIIHKYSTTDFIARTCYEISLMDAMQNYFTYEIGEGCGISKIKLLGTLEDWIKLRENIEKLREFGLDKWIDQLCPILDQFIRLYKGDIDEEFWGNIYRHQPSPGIYFESEEYATGWIIVGLQILYMIIVPYNLFPSFTLSN